MSKYFIFWTFLLVPFLCTSCGDDDAIRDVDLSLVTLEDGKSLIFGNWYAIVSGDFIQYDNYYSTTISETGIDVDKTSPYLSIYVTEWTKVSDGIRASGYRTDWIHKEQYECSVVFQKILDQKLYIKDEDWGIIIFSKSKGN